MATEVPQQPATPTCPAGDCAAELIPHCNQLACGWSRCPDCAARSNGRRAFTSAGRPIALAPNERENR